MVAGRLQALSEAARSQVSGFTEVGQAIAASGDQASEAVKRQLREMSAAVEQAAARLTEIRSALREQSSELTGTTDLAVERLRDIGEIYHHQSAALAAAIDRAGSKAKETAAMFGEQTTAFLKAANDASAMAERAKGAAIGTQQDSFLRSATFIIETLQSLSVDLTRVLDQPVPESIWKRFHAGERAIFTRHLLQMHDRQADVIIKKKFEEDSGFRDYVLRYLDQFEGVLAQARDCDRLDVLGATFLTADVGKLYLVLSNAIGRPKQ
jgi:hypothetical protein